MSNPDDQHIFDKLDREASDRGGLVTLVLCLLVAGGLLMAGAMGILGQN